MSWRRFLHVVAVSAALALGLGAADAARAAADSFVVDTATPESLVRTLSTGVLDDIRSDRAIRSGDVARLQRLIDARILPYVDMERTTRLVVGRAWRQATPAQRAAIMTQFRLLLVHTYAGALSRVTDEKVHVLPVREQPYPDDAIIRTQILSATSANPIDLAYRLGKTDRGWQIYDLNIMGIWLVQTYKSEFNEIINQRGIDGLIRMLTEKNQQLAVKKSS